jgi:hypothetical protein
MTFPFEPKAVLHKHGGRIVKINGIGHTIDKPSEGRSRDSWFFRGEIEWRDGTHSRHAEIAPYALCYTDEQPEGHAEIIALSAAMSEYLEQHGEWCDRKSKHEGWYAHDRKVSRRA